jgi:hypothetical protein
MQDMEYTGPVQKPKKRKVWKIIRLSLLGIILFFIFLFLLLRLSTVQTYIASKYSNYLSEKTNTEIQIGRIDISGLLKIKIFDLYVVDQEDTLMVDSKTIEIDIKLTDLFENKLHVKSVQIDSTYFALMEDSRDQELSLMKLVDYFLSDDTTSSESTIEILVDRLDIRNSHYRMDLWSTLNFDEGGMNYTHLDIDSINLSISDFRVEADTLVGFMEHLTAHDICGFRLNEFAGQVRVSSKGISIDNFHLKTNSSWAYLGNYQMIYTQWTDWYDFIDKVKFKAKIDSAQLNMDDIKYFATSMEGMLNTLRFNGNVRGPISKLKLRKGNVSFKKRSRFIGDITVAGLPEIEQTFMLIKAKEIRLNNREAVQFYLPGKEKLVLPELLNKLGNILIKGRFTGFYNDFVSKARFKTDLGVITTDLLLKPYRQGSNKLEYHGKLTTNHFKIGGITGNDTYGGVTMTAKLDGIGLKEDADALYNIDIKSIYISKYEYKDVKIDGSIKNEHIEAKLNTRDEAFVLNAIGSFDYHDSLPSYTLDMTAEHARIYRLFLVDKDTLGNISGKVKLDMKGNTLDNLSGTLAIDSLTYSIHNKTYQTDSIRLETNTKNNFNRFINLKSEWVDANINGQFRLSELEMMYRILFKDIFPSLVKTYGIGKTELIDTNDFLSDDNINYQIDIKNSSDLYEIFFPEASIASGTKMYGFFNISNDSMVFNLSSPKISYSQYYAENLKIQIIKPPKKLLLDLESSYLKSESVFAFDSMEIDMLVVSDTIDYHIKWGRRNNHTNNGKFGGEVILTADSIDARFTPGNFWVNDTLWQLSDKASIKYTYHNLEVKSFSIYSKENRFDLYGSLTEKPSDILHFDFQNFDLSLLDFYLTENYYTDLDGHLTGKFELSNIWTSVGFSSEFQIKNFFLNKSYLGNASVNSMYSRSRDAFVIDMVLQNPKDSIPIKYLDLGGFYYPNRRSNNFDLDLYFNNYPLESLKSYLSSFTTDVVGKINGKLNIDGSIEEPIISGALDADIPRLKIDYIGTTYHLKDKLVFNKEYFGFDNIYIYDNEYKGGNTHRALSTIQIRHKNYSNYSLNIDIKPDKLKALNLKSHENELFYGKAYGSGEFKLYGPFDELSLRLDIKSEDKSKISIPISSEIVAEKADFITFVQKTDSLNISHLATKVEEDDFSIDLDMSMEVNPNTQMEIVMDEVVGDKITARGQGKIRIVYDRDDNLNMYGNYIIDRGDYLFTMQNVINKHFTIDPGSKIIWNGDPEDAQISMKAIYKTDAKLYDLLQQVDPSEEYKKRASKVNCIINIEGTLYSPRISFDIDLPEESMATRELVKQLLTLSDGENGSEELNKNFISLLVLGRFLPPSGYESGANPDAISKNATEMVANQVGNILNKLSDNVEIGLDWNPGDEMTTQEVAIALSYSMLDDRLVIDGRFGTGGGSNSPESAQRIVGDLNVEYKFTNDGRIRGKVFNRTNYYDPLTRKAPYTQGVGIVYRKEFDNLYELFHRTKAEQDEIAKNEEASKKRKERRKLKKEARKKNREEKKRSKETAYNKKAVKPEEVIEFK